jgi:hypothetical protein
VRWNKPISNAVRIADELNQTIPFCEWDDSVGSEKQTPLSRPPVAEEEIVDSLKNLLHDCILSYIVPAFELVVS